MTEKSAENDQKKCAKIKHSKIVILGPKLNVYTQKFIDLYSPAYSYIISVLIYY